MSRKERRKEERQAKAQKRVQWQASKKQRTVSTKADVASAPSPRGRSEGVNSLQGKSIQLAATGRVGATKPNSQKGRVSALSENNVDHAPFRKTRGESAMQDSGQEEGGATADKRAVGASRATSRGVPGGGVAKLRQGPAPERKRRRVSRFEESLEADKRGGLGAGTDLELERRLAKKLKLKQGKLPGADDGLQLLFGSDEEGDEMGLFPEEGFDVTRSRKMAGGQRVRPQREGSMKAVRNVEGEEEENESDFEEMHTGDESEEDGGGEKDEDEAEDEDEDEDEDEEEDEEEDEDEDNEGQGSDFEEMLMGDEREEEMADSDEDDDSYQEKGGELAKQQTVEEKGASKARGGSSVLAGKYVAPHLRGRGGAQDLDLERVQRRLRGLLNRLSESNVESIAADVALIFQTSGRTAVGQMVADEILGACVSGPRGNDLYAAVFAAFVSGCAATVGIDFGANFAAHLALKFEEQYAAGDSLALRNLTLLLGHLYTSQLFSSELVFELLGRLCERFQELDVATIVHLLQACGMTLRGDDPQAMRDFILSVHARAAKARLDGPSPNAAAPSDAHPPPQAPGPGGAGGGRESVSIAKAPFSKRVAFMLDTICDIKNNRRRAKDEGPPVYARLKKWLVKLNVEDVQLRAVTWQVLLDPDKKGQWWLPGPSGGSSVTRLSDTANHLAGMLDADMAEASRMLQLAASQRMNTDARRAVFCVIMSSEDYLDAFEKILRLKLPGKQDREVVRVVVDCCLQEKAFNKYYALLAARLAAHHRNHKFTLQYCVWDHFKELGDMDLRRSASLARLVAHCIGSFALSISILKAVDFSDPKVMTSKVALHFRMLLEALLCDFPEASVWAAFSRAAAPPSLAPLRDGLAVFLHQHMQAHALSLSATPGGGRGALLRRQCKLAKKALANVAGIPQPNI